LINRIPQTAVFNNFIYKGNITGNFFRNILYKKLLNMKLTMTQIFLIKVVIDILLLIKNTIMMIALMYMF